MTQSKTSSVLIVAAEASSTLYAQRLLEHWKSQGLGYEGFGVGSYEMETLGFDCMGRSEELAVMGLQEVFSHRTQIFEAFDAIIEQAKKRKPNVALLLDYPGFNMRLAKKLKAMGIPVVYYISPQIWAWRTSRVYKIKKIVDKMLVIFPFEKDFYNKYEVPVEFVGHPLLDELNPGYFSKKEINRKRQRYGVLSDEKLIALMPGSRKSELDHHFLTQIDVAQRIHDQHPEVKLALFVAPSLAMNEIKNRLPRIDFPLMVIKEENPLNMIQMADLVLTASGTATLLVGLLEKPMVIMYKMNAITAFLAKRIVKSTEYFGMINLVLGKEVVPELFQEQASPENLYAHLKKMMNDQKLFDSTKEQLKQAKHLLGDKGATKRVAEALKEYLE